MGATRTFGTVWLLQIVFVDGWQWLAVLAVLADRRGVFFLVRHGSEAVACHLNTQLERFARMSSSISADQTFGFDRSSYWHPRPGPAPISGASASLSLTVRHAVVSIGDHSQL